MFESNSQFEDEVRRIGRLLWPSAQYDGAAIEDGRERDGIFETPEFVHVMECTVSRLKSKAEEDSRKIAKLIRQLAVKKPNKFIKGWFVTLEEPTADQRLAVKQVLGKEKLQGAQIVALSFDQFRAQLVDARSYLTQRRSYPFGSVRDPTTGKASYEINYIPLRLIDESDKPFDLTTIANSLVAGESFVLLGDYGGGKSATLRELYLLLTSLFWKNGTLRFPIHLNLRDHHGQTDPVEAIERHARRVGFESPSSLVRAWRGGFAILILDGFDEIAAAGWAGKTRSLKELRYRSMELVRAFIRDNPPGTGLILCGRAHFFDSGAEMKTALAIKPTWHTLSVTEFSEQQIEDFLNKLGWKAIIPAWLPSRPLLLEYLASRFADSGEFLELGTDPASGWDSLISRIAERESEIEAGIDPETVRRLIEHLAMLARSSVDGLGPLSSEVIVNSFKTVCGYQPDDRGAVLLQRLPGLGAHHLEDGSRVFIDKDFAEAARGGATFRIIENPYGLAFDSDTWQTTLTPLGAQVAAARSEQAGFAPTKVSAGLLHIVESQQAYTIGADLGLVLLELGACLEDEVFIREVIIPELVFEDTSCDLSKLEVQDSIISLLVIGPGFTQERQLPKFVRCYFGSVDGRAGPQDLAGSHFIDCEYGSFDESARTTNSILRLSLPLGTKVMLTILKKLYAQSGSGRKESAFYRGLDARAQALVPDVLALLRQEGMAIKSARGSHNIWLPTRSKDSHKRALAMLAAPNAANDPLLVASGSLH